LGRKLVAIKAMRVDSFNDLVGRLRDGEDRAAQEVFDRFVARLVGLARSQIDAGLRHKVDPEDVVQSALRSFFRRQEASEFELKDWDGLWGLLSLITVRKCAKKAEHTLAARRGGGREVSLPAHDADTGVFAIAIDRQPTPEDAAILLETVEEALREFDPEDRQVIELSLQGYGAVEISEKLCRAERSVRRLRERIKKRLLSMMDQESVHG
jgi:RNA polymerase sigma-70 factor (ECF subfamily)